MILSFSTSTDERAMLNFQRGECPTVGSIQRYVLSHAWSPCVWDGNIRAKKRFLFSDLCALDFDSGEWTLQDARNMLDQADLAGVIGTTKSHQLEKAGRTCDRFRVVMPWASRITDAATYEQNMARMVKHTKADSAAKDAARFFWPCVEIVYYRPGRRLDWEPLKAVKQREPPSDEWKRARIVPPYVKRIAAGAREGERNKLTYWLAKRLRDLNFTAHEVEEELAPLFALDRKELSRTVLSAFQNST